MDAYANLYAFKRKKMRVQVKRYVSRFEQNVLQYIDNHSVQILDNTHHWKRHKIDWLKEDAAIYIKYQIW